MEFGLDKCVKCTFVQGKTKRTANISIDQSTTIQELENETSHKYLGKEEGLQVQHKKNAQNNQQGGPTQNKTNYQVIPLPKKQNQSKKRTCSAGIPI